MKSKQTNDKETREASSGLLNKKSIIRLSVVFFCLVLLHFAFVFLLRNNDEGYHIINRTWGFNHISYFPIPAVILFYGIALFIIYPYTSTKLLPSLSGKALPLITAYFSEIRSFFFLLIAGAFVYVFTVFKIKYAFLGDLDLRVTQTINKDFILNDYGTMFVFYYLYHFLHLISNYTPTQAFQLGSALSGGLFVFIALHIADILGKTHLQKLSIALFAIAIGATQFFFGYLEVYALPAAFFALYLYTSILCLKGKLNIVIPLIVLILTIWSHFLGIGLAPSFFVLAYKKHLYKWPLLKKLTVKTFVIIILCCLPLPYLIGPLFGLNDIMLYPTPPDKNFPNQLTLFSFTHLWEFLNSQILASGLGFFTLLFITYKALRKQIRFDNTLWFLSTASFFTLYITFITDSSRGSGDWDTMAFPAIAYSIMVVYCLIYNYHGTQYKKLLVYVIPVLITFNLLNLITWVGVNASDKSITKIADMIEYDPGTYYVKDLPADLLLAQVYSHNGLHQESYVYYNKLLKSNTADERVYYDYAIDLMGGNDTAKAIPILEECVKKFAYYAPPYNSLLYYYQHHKMFHSNVSTAHKMFKAYEIKPQSFNSFIGRLTMIQCFRSLYTAELYLKNDSAAADIKAFLDKNTPR